MICNTSKVSKKFSIQPLSCEISYVRKKKYLKWN